MTDLEKQEQSRRDVALAHLKIVFGLQIPPSTQQMVIARMLTIAARDQIEKVTKQVAELLEVVGAKVPRIHPDKRIACFGVLFQEGHKLCMNCSLKPACQTEAHNVGLAGPIVINKALLGSRQPRIPVCLVAEGGPKLQDGVSPMLTLDETEIMGHLEEVYTAFTRKDDLFYGLTAEAAGKQIMLFHMVQCEPTLLLRFVNPSQDLIKHLTPKNKGYYLPSGLDMADAQELIEQHTKESIDRNA